MNCARQTVRNGVLIGVLGLASTLAGGCSDPGPGSNPVFVVTPESAALLVGDTTRATPMGNGHNLTGSEVEWVARDPATASVNSNGLITAVAKGTTVVVARWSGLEDSVFVAVQGRPVRLRIVPDTVWGIVGDTMSVTAQLLDDSGATVELPVEWSSSAPTIAAIGSSGRLRVLRAGYAVVRASWRELADSVGLTSTVSLSAIALGNFHTCSLSVRGATVCWGSSDHGQIGTPGVAVSPIPLAVPVDTRFERVSAGGEFTCGLSAGSVWCWGRGSEGQVGDGARVSRSTPVVVRSSGDSAITAGGQHACSMAVNRQLWCWGNNNFGQLGNPTSPLALRPVLAANGQLFRAVSAGASHTCGVADSGDGFCWGWNQFGQLGDGTLTGGRTPVRVAGDLTFRTIAAGDAHTCAVATDGSVWCWGRGDAGQRGDGSTDVVAAMPQRALLTGTFQSVTAGGNHSCAVATTGELWCWGSGDYGQLGNGAFASSSVPVRVALAESVVEVSAGLAHTCALAIDGIVWCWGLGGSGRLGTGSTDSRASPTRVAGQP